MKVDNTNYKAIGKGLYKAAFSLCILFMCVITVVITGNYNKSKTSDSDADYASKIDQSEQYVSADSVEDALTEDEGVLNASEETDTKVSETEMTEKYIIDFEPPLAGDVLKDFSKDIPIYNKTMDDWRIHTGIDICAPYGTAVTSSESGVVTKVGYDINYGNFVEIEVDNFLCRYTSLESGITLAQGDAVSKGDIVGYLSDSCISEICDEAHLHFEMKKDGEFVNPADYIY